MKMNRVQFQAGLSMPEFYERRGTEATCRAALQTTAEGRSILACLRQQPHTSEEMAVFAAAHIDPSATVVSDGLWCFCVTTFVGAEHERIVTRGGQASVKLPRVKALDTSLGNLKVAIRGIYHAFDFAKYAHRYLAEFQYRFNRRFSMKTVLTRPPHLFEHIRRDCVVRRVATRVWMSTAGS